MNVYGWVCVLFMLLIAHKTCSFSPQQRLTVFSGDKSYDGRSCEIDAITVQADHVVNSIMCGRVCQRKSDCRSFFYNSDSRQCYGCRTGYGVNNNKTTSQTLIGSVYYVNYRYVGCFYDEYSSYLLGRQYVWVTNMTTEVCINMCASVGYKYAATEATYWCICGDILGTLLQEEESSCSEPCSADPTVKCGGHYRASLYALGLHNH